MMPSCLNHLLCSWFTFDGFRGPSQSWGGDGGGVEGGPAPSSQLIKKKQTNNPQLPVGASSESHPGEPQQGALSAPCSCQAMLDSTEASPCRQGREVWHGFPNTSTRLREKSLPGVFVTARDREAGKRICIFQVPAMCLAESRDCKI